MGAKRKIRRLPEGRAADDVAYYLLMVCNEPEARGQTDDVDQFLNRYNS